MMPILVNQRPKLTTSYHLPTLCSLPIGQRIITGELSPFMLPVLHPKPQLLVFSI